MADVNSLHIWFDISWMVPEDIPAPKLCVKHNILAKYKIILLFLFSNSEKEYIFLSLLEVAPYLRGSGLGQQVVLEGNRLVLTCLAGGSWPLQYRWTLNNSNITDWTPQYRSVSSNMISFFWSWMPLLCLSEFLPVRLTSFFPSMACLHVQVCSIDKDLSLLVMWCELRRSEHLDDVRLKIPLAI